MTPENAGSDQIRLYREESECLKKQIEELRMENYALRDKCNMLDYRCREQEAEKDELKAEKDKLEAVCRNLETELVALKDKHVRWGNDGHDTYYDELFYRMKEQCESMQVSLAQLTKECQALSNQCSKLEEENKALRSVVAQ